MVRQGCIWQQCAATRRSCSCYWEPAQTPTRLLLTETPRCLWQHRPAMWSGCFGLLARGEVRAATAPCQRHKRDCCGASCAPGYGYALSHVFIVFSLNFERLVCHA